ncbi:2739_t:CDS:2 [Funneliformis geosporum]|uniref:2979_t:CDS:1 n=1 Tax=Funneliformis geosporum TaxID=1117311 RepID=A0A9W4SJM8_9GLOM|nr:2739_t:CDS:2 [Funneliformis geosporum]CAI2170706.1 2979_t:CDS:2 [Funneliformis geosporum]
MTTSATPVTPALPKKAKRTRTNMATVTLPKCESAYKLLDEATRERQEEMAEKSVTEEAKKRFPDTNSKPDIFQSSSFLMDMDDKIIIVNYPKNKKEKREKREKDIKDTLNALHGTKNDNSTQDMPQGAIEALEKLLGKVPDQQKTRGSNYGRLAQDFTFPAKQQSTAGRSKGTKEEESAASSSKTNENARETGLEELDKKERARRRKSNLNALAPSFKPTFASSGSSTDQNRSDSDSKTEVDDRKKKNKKEKAVLDVNGDTELPYQRKPRKSSQQILPSELSALDTTTGSYGSFVSTSFDQAFFVPAAPPPPFPVQYVENSPPNWEEFQKNLSSEVVSRVEMEVQKHIVKLVSEVRTTLAETKPECTTSSSSASDKRKDDTIRRLEETERKNEEIRFNKMQEQFLQELQDYQQDIRSSHEEFLLRHEEVQTRHLQLQAELKQTKDEVQSTSNVQRRHVELQNMLQKELSQLDELKTRLQEMQNEHRKMQDRQQQLHDEMTDSQALRHRLSEFDAEVAQLRFKNNKLIEENTLLANEFAKRSEEYKMKERKQDTMILELQSELNLVRNKNNQVELSLEGQMQKFRLLQNENQKLFEENTTTKNSHQSNISELKSKLQQVESREESLRTSYRQLEEEASHYNSLKEFQEKIENEKTELLRKNPRKLENETIQTIQKELAVHRTSKKTLENRVNELNKVRQELEEEVVELAELRPRIKELEKQASDLERTCLKMKELETHSVELDRYRRRAHELETELKSLRQRVRESENHSTQIESLQKMCQDLEVKFDNKSSEVSQLRHDNSELTKEANTKAEEVVQRTLDLKQILERNQSLQNKNSEITNELAELRMRLQMNVASTSTVSYSPIHTPRVMNNDIIDDHRMSRDILVYNSPSFPNNSFEHSNYNRIKSPNTPNIYSQQTYSQIPNMSSQSSQSSQPSQIMASGINFQHPTHQYPIHYSSTNHLQCNQPPQDVQSVPLHQIPPMQPVVQLPHTNHQLQSAQASSQMQQQMPQQMHTHPNLPPLMTFHSQSTNVSAQPSPTTSLGFLSHPTQQKNGKAHNRSGSNNLGSNPKQTKQKKKKQHSNQHKGVNDNVAINANNSQTNDPDSNASKNPWNKSELNNVIWWEHGKN